MADSLKTLLELLKTHRWTMSFAESCTGGLLSAQVTAQAGVSEVFLGSVVSYSNEAKEALLGVSSETLKAHGAVSEPVALEMAEGAREKFGSNWSVAITGIAGPSGGSVEKPVGTVCFGISGRWGSEKIDEAMTCHFAGTRTEIQSQAAEHAMRYLIDWMTKKRSVL